MQEFILPAPARASTGEIEYYFIALKGHNRNSMIALSPGNCILWFLSFFFFFFYLLTHVWYFATPWTIAHQVPLSMRFPRQEYWNRLRFPSPGNLPNSGIEFTSPAWQADSLLPSHLDYLHSFPQPCPLAQGSHQSALDFYEFVFVRFHT